MSSSASWTILTRCSTTVPCSTLRVPQAALGLGDLRACALSRASGRGVGAPLLAGRSQLLFSSVSGGGTSPFLVPPSGEEAAALPGASAAEVVPNLMSDPETLLVDSALLAVLHPRQVPQSAGFGGAAWARGTPSACTGQAALALRHEPRSNLLRAHPRQHGRGLCE